MRDDVVDDALDVQHAEKDLLAVVAVGREIIARRSMAAPTR